MHTIQAAQSMFIGDKPRLDLRHDWSQRMENELVQLFPG